MDWKGRREFFIDFSAILLCYVSFRTKAGQNFAPDGNPDKKAPKLDNLSPDKFPEISGFRQKPPDFLSSLTTMLLRVLSRSKALTSSISAQTRSTPSRSNSNALHPEETEKLFRYTRGRWLYNEHEREGHLCDADEALR